MNNFYYLKYLNEGYTLRDNFVTIMPLNDAKLEFTILYRNDNYKLINYDFDMGWTDILDHDFELHDVMEYDIRDNKLRQKNLNKNFNRIAKNIYLSSGKDYINILKMIYGDREFTDSLIQDYRIHKHPITLSSLFKYNPKDQYRLEFTINIDGTTGDNNNDILIDVFPLKFNVISRSFKIDKIKSNRVVDSQFYDVENSTVNYLLMNSVSDLSEIDKYIDMFSEYERDLKYDSEIDINDYIK